PSNTFQYLQYTSSHPRYVINNIPLSLSNRIVRLCSSPSTMWREFYNLFNRLLARGHRASNILQKILQIQQFNRKELIYRPKKQNENNDSKKYKNIVIPYHSQLPNIKKIINNNYSIDVPDTYRLVYKCSSNLASLLMRSRYPSSFFNVVPVHHINPMGCVKCNHPQCGTCKYLVIKNYFVSTVTNQIYNIPYNVNCGSTNLSYLITCNLCNMQYGGTTSQKLRDRFRQHRSSIRKNSGNDTRCIEHFNRPGHSLENHRVIIIETNYTNEQHRLDREQYWIKTLKTQINDSNNH
ncbi:unnamed protein product, partial [Didymodactylos carnosus]